MEAVTTTLPLRDVERARVAVATTFGLNGLVFASWVSRLPAVRQELDLSTTGLGLLLLCLSAGSVIGLPTSGPLVDRLGPARTVLSAVLLLGVGLLLVAVGVGSKTVPLTGAGLLLVGLGVGSWDVAMNVEGADVERRLGRDLMPRLHAGFSLGTVLGAVLGAGAAQAGLDVAVQLAGTAVAAVAGVVLCLRAYLPVPPHDAETRPGLRASQAWREPRTLLIGVVVLCFAFTEGTANEWTAIALVDGHGASQSVGALGFACFVVAMTASRTLGASLLARHGRTLVLRVTAVLAAAGLLLVVTAPGVPLALVGSLLWGTGAALGFPVGMSAAADDPHGAAVRVSVVSSIGYTAFLAGPPLVGLLAEPERLGVLRALLVVLVALAVGATAARAAAPPGPVVASSGRQVTR
ncbi:MAG: major facilitator superfamily 1 [Frankiales bacterium]|nr:major facilitator superfamily 1 [Frankiales bacterium]